MKIRAATAALALVLAACYAAQPEARWTLDVVEEYSAQGRYEDALIAAEAYRQSNPDDPEAIRQFRRAQAAVVLDQAREDCFAERNLEALQKIRTARHLDPDERVLADWELKMERKLALIHTGRGDEFFASGDLEEARVQYEQALEYVSDDPTAKLGLAQVLIQLSHRRHMGEGYYEQGVHLLREYWLEQAKQRFAYTSKYLPKNERAKERRKDVATQLAEERCTLAADLEREGLWAAARNEYRIALLIDENHAVAKEGFVRTRVEADAEDKLREVERLTRSKDFDEAKKTIEVGLALTKHQSDRFEGARAGIEEAILDASYSTALALESDQDFEQAVAAYDKLLSQRDYYKDALARRDTLKDYLEKAPRLYQQAMDATDPMEKLGYLRQVAVFWPEYKNVEELIELLKPAAGGEKPAEPVPEPVPEPVKDPAAAPEKDPR